MKAKTKATVELSAIVVKACKCGHKREMGKPCEGCGSTKPPKVIDLGIIAATHKNRWKRIKWNLWGCHAARRRIHRMNREACGQ
jgi:hypothetical protein